MDYKKRIVDNLLDLKLESFGATLIKGPKGCGKTTSAKQKAKSYVEFQDEEVRDNLLAVAETAPKKLLIGEKPRLFDEWQDAPKLWGTIRKDIDDSGENGQYILTGSSSKDVKVTHTGTLRISQLQMYPMSLYESEESNGTVSLLDLFDTPDSFDGCESNLTIDDLIFAICRGGWPIATTLEEEYALEPAFSYYNAVTDVDVSRIDGIKRSPARAKRLMRSLARHQGTQVSLARIKADMAANDTDSLDVDTVSSYIEVLKKIFVIEDMEAWNPNLRSKAAIRTSDTRYFVDSSIATAALGVGPADLLKDLNTMGLFFETMAVRDLRVYAESIDGNVFHYRDSNGLECDAVIHLRNGKYGLVEIKIGGQALINDGVETLNRLASVIDTEKMNKPSFRMILTAVGNLAYRRDDGIYVVPISCLKP